MMDATKALMLTPADGPALSAVAELVAAAVNRREALGLAGPLTAGEYRAHLERLLELAAAGDAGLGVVTDAQGVVLGTAQWTRSPYRTRRVLAEIDRVCVAPHARGFGVGRILVELAVADAADHGVEVLGLEVRGNNHGALALYERCGFRRTGLIPNAVAEDLDRYDVVLMHRELPRPHGLRLVGSEPIGSGSSTPRRAG
ncbi:GNAT family N-acetyltransferase [Actinospica durhamensis]|uniref:GNAT family N-acetyltransferase n=1 Tax=Actinospica durhamensis TaxID=1508375 RepID=A0A941IUL7_9ACTN|nr:GNAT family N-acetyltransferase [Actinospica durhamensis]MBR7837688.1 GNAT family N-acetyltransferase [Actinospica durhamensis]